ncbi:transposase [Nitrosomonas mobilis]|uniref:transposase n=1 Tax=Nitrosomonas mobilis TaxID=51642 RepID=UPI003CCC2583
MYRVYVSKDHVHIPGSCPLKMAPSEIMRRIKGRTSSYIPTALQILALKRDRPMIWKFCRINCKKAYFGRAGMRFL